MFNCQNIQSIIICSNYTKVIFHFSARIISFFSSHGRQLIFSIAVFFLSFFVAKLENVFVFRCLISLPIIRLKESLSRKFCIYIFFFLPLILFIDSDTLWLITFRSKYQTLHKHKQDMSSWIQTSLRFACIIWKEGITTHTQLLQYHTTCLIPRYLIPQTTCYPPIRSSYVLLRSLSQLLLSSSYQMCSVRQGMWTKVLNLVDDISWGLKRRLISGAASM